MRILNWHGWLLEGSGSNVYTARVTQAWRADGHDILLLCQEPHPERFGFIDAWGTVGGDGVSELRSTGAAPAAGRAVLLRPDIGSLLPVFVLDEYEGFTVARFVDLSDDQLDVYVERNARALEAAAGRHRPDAVVVGHAVAGPAVARRVLGSGSYVAKLHGSDVEYAVRLQPRYADLAREGLEGARTVVGASDDVLRRALEFVPAVAGRTRVVAPGVEVERFRPRERRAALQETAVALEADPETSRGRPDDLDAEVSAAVDARDAGLLTELAGRYDQTVPDQAAARRLRDLAPTTEPLVGYVGKFIPQKGVHLLLEALPRMRTEPGALLVGFGLHREWLAAVVQAMDRGDGAALRWLQATLAGDGEPPDDVPPAPGAAARVTFTGRLDHRYAPGAIAAMDVLVVPSILDEAFGMVAAEGAAAGVLPLVARHSGLAAIAEALEGAAGRPGLFSFEQGPGAGARIAAGVDGLLALDPHERAELRSAVTAFVASNWTWDRTAEDLLEAAAGARA